MCALAAVEGNDTELTAYSIGRDIIDWKCSTTGFVRVVHSTGRDIMYTTSQIKRSVITLHYITITLQMA